MTTDTLERDLKSLAEPEPGDDQMRRAIRATLVDQLQPRPRRRRVHFALGSATLAAATIAAAIVVLAGTGGPTNANAAILHHATSALNPPANLIVHVKETGTLADGTPVSAEWWQETNAPYAMRLIKTNDGRGGEASSDGTTNYQYDATSGTIYRQPDSNVPTLIDPIETLRAALANGTAQVAGTVTIDGAQLYKIELPNGVVGYFDRSTYRPMYIDNLQRGGSVVRTHVDAYEELAQTSANESLLSVTAQHPGARVQDGPPPDSGAGVK